MASPTVTSAMPAVPEWAHPTPSPSLMVRMPDPKAWQAPNFGSMLNGKAMAPDPQAENIRALLSQVCAPFVQGMLNAVEQLVEKEVERQVKQLRQQDQIPAMPPWAPRRLSREQQHSYGDAMAFGKVFDAHAAPGEDSMKLGNVSAVPLPEESSEDEAEAEGDQRGRFQALFGGKVPTSCSRSSSRSKSESSEEPNPSGFGGQAETDKDPLYLQWSQGQAMGDRPALTPTVSPVAPHLAPGGAMGLNVPAESHNADSPGGQAKSAVVCRHWKSKGWCRMGNECKFAHPEHKCGAGLPAKKEKDKAANLGRAEEGQAQEKKSEKPKAKKNKGQVGQGKEVRASPALTPGLVNPNS